MQLIRLYSQYNPLEDVASFMGRAVELFPHLNCGIASIYLQARLNAGEVKQGSYHGQNHTFLQIGDDTVVDITADQYGGPKIYVGPLEPPWSLVSSNTLSG